MGCPRAARAVPVSNGSGSAARWTDLSQRVEPFVDRGGGGRLLLGLQQLEERLCHVRELRRVRARHRRGQGATWYPIRICLRPPALPPSGRSRPLLCLLEPSSPPVRKPKSVNDAHSAQTSPATGPAPLWYRHTRGRRAGSVSLSCFDAPADPRRCLRRATLRRMVPL